MSKQEEEIPTYALPYEDGPKKPYFDKEYIESKINDFSEAHKGETAEQIEAECRGEEVPIEVCGKKVVVRYAKDGAPCEKCVLNGIRGCGTSKCSRLDKVGMEIDERAYFVEAEQPEADLDAEIFAWQKAHATEETKQIIAMTARHFAEWGVEHADKPIYEVSSRGKSAMGDKFFDWLQFGTHAIWDWMVKTDWYKKLQDMSDELIVKVYLGKKRSKK